MGYGKWITGALGWALGGPIGGIIGFAIGSIFEKGKQLSNINSKNRLQVVLTQI
jgi:DnaJ like chaperone protein